MWLQWSIEDISGRGSDEMAPTRQALVVLVTPGVAMRLARNAIQRLLMVRHHWIDGIGNKHVLPIDQNSLAVEQGELDLLL